MSGDENLERELESFLREDDSRLAALYRKLPRPEPDAALDAAVLAMARRAAAAPAPRPAPRRRHWLPLLGAAATVALAVGIAYRLAPQLGNQRGVPASSGASDAARREEAQAPAATTQAAPPARPAPPAAVTPPVETDRRQLQKVENAAAPAPAPFPGATDATAAAAKAPAPAAAGRVAANREAEMKKSAAAVSESAAAPASMSAPAQAAAAPAEPALRVGTPAGNAFEAPKPAKDRAQDHAYSAAVLRNSRLYPESWIAEIQRLLRAGRREEARQNLELFRSKYPDYRLPEDLRDLP